MKIVDLVLFLVILIINVVASEHNRDFEEDWIVVGTPRGFRQPDLRHNFIKYNIERSDDEMTGILYTPPSEERNECILPQIQEAPKDTLRKSNIGTTMFSEMVSDNNIIRQYRLFPISVDEMTGIPELKYTNYFEYRAFSEKAIKSIFDKMSLFFIDTYDPLQFVKKSSLSVFRYIYENKWYAGMICSCFVGAYGILRIT